MSQLFIYHGDTDGDGHINMIDYVWTVAMPICCIWYLLVFAVFIRGFLSILMRQFKPLYILGNALIFSVATFSYFFPTRGYIELTGKVFDFCAFTCIALSDAIPDPLRLYFHRAFLPLFIFLYAAVIFPRLYWDVDRNARVQCMSFGTESVCNTTLACQVLINLLIWFTYIVLNSAAHPESFHLLLARVQVKEEMRRSSFNGGPGSERF
jgi:hypothetical protein